MSLINQMLKDLEKRRADSVASPDSPLKGVNRYSVARRRPPYLLYALGSLLLALAVLVGFLGWAYINPSQQDQAKDTSSPSPQKLTRSAAPTQTPTPVATATAEEPVQETNTSPQQRQTATQADDVSSSAPAESTTPSRQADEPAPSSTPVVDDSQAVQSSTQSAAADESATSVSKRNRPLSDEQRAELAYRKGYQQLGRDQTEQGEQYLREALSHYRRHHRARELLAGVYIKSGRYVEAASLLKEGVALAPGHSLFAKLYARVLLKQNQPQQAIAVLERQPPMPGLDSEYHALLAAIYQQAGQHFKAAATYRDVLRLDPRRGNWWIGLGVSLEQLQKYDEARAAYQRASNSTNLTENLRQYVDQRLAALSDREP